METYLQYRRFKRYLETQIKENGIEATANVQQDFPIKDIKGSERNTTRRPSSKEDGTERCAEDIASKQTAKADAFTGATNQALYGTQSPSLADKKQESDFEKASESLSIVGFQDPDDPFYAQNWSFTRKCVYTTIIGLTGFVVSGAAAFDTEITPQASKYFGVSEEVELLSTTLYMVGLGVGSLVSAPFSETVGRSPVYIVCLTIFALFEMGAALATNIQTQLICRFFAALFGCPPVTTVGGSLADMWSPLERTYIFPVLSVPTFLGPFLAPVVADFIATSPLVSWRWTEWITMILAGWVVAMLFFFVPETYGPVLLEWKAKHLRKITGDDRYTAPSEVTGINLGIRLLRSVSRPIQILLTEPIVDLFSLYLVIVYIIMFGFLPGFDFIFGKDGVYGFDQAHSGLPFLAMNVGFIAALIPIRPLYKRFKHKLAAAQEAGVNKVGPEERLLFAMMGAPFMPISIFWMGWTSWPSISYWSPIVASAFFGFASLAIFISSYQYIIDSYEMYAASALVGMTVTRYCASGPMVIVSVPMYENLGVHWALTLVGCLSLLMTPVPYIFYRYGAAIRKRSRSATNFQS